MNEKDLTNQNTEPATAEQQEQQEQQPAQEPQTQVQTQEPTETIQLSDLMKENADLKANNAKLKSYMDKYASEVGDLKKQIRATMTEAEQQAQQKLEAEKAKDERLAQLEHNEKLRDATERYMTIGLTKESAKTLAEAELDGDMDTVTSSIIAHMNAIKKETEERVRAELLAQMPAPVSGNGDGQVDYQKQAADALANGDTQGFIMAQLKAAQEAQS